MPRKLELDALKAELSGLKALLSELKDLNDPVGIMQYREREKELELEINALEQEQVHTASLALYFGGKPALGSRGLAADFAGRTLELFQELVSKKFAKNEIGELGKRGRIPLKDATTLMVTGITHGSFGFLLEELNDQVHLFDTDLKDMINGVIQLIDSASSIDEINFEKAIETIDPRTLMALKDFFIDLDSSEATIRIVDDVNELSLDKTSIHRARIRTESTQIDEQDTIISGILLGFLPEHRRFEIQIISGETIYGIATKESTEQYSNTMKDDIPAIGKKCTAKIKERTVKPINRSPKIVYRLLEFTSLGEDD